MPADVTMATQERLAEIINSGDIDSLDEVFAVDVVDHDPAPDQRSGPDGFKDFFRTLRSAFPDLHIEPATVVTDDDHVCIAYTISGTHQGEFQGIQPTGHSVTARGVQIARFQDGKIVERWGSSDERGLLAQLGATPTTGATVTG
ncbi:MAG: ester cyclase [Nocardioidaceae bacterium]